MAISKFSSRLHTAVTLAALGYSAWEKLKLFIGYGFILILWKIHPHDISLPVSIRCAGKRLDIFLTGYSDFCVLREVFVQQEYKLEEKRPISSIVDAGSNVGFAALYFAVRYPDARVICFEPDPHTFAKLCRNTKPFKNIECFNAGLGARNEIRTFYVYPDSSISSSYIRRREDQKELQIPVWTLDKVMRDVRLQSLSLLKFDVEGYEAELLKGIAHPESIRHYIGEIHLDLATEGRQWFADYFSGCTVHTTDLSSNRYILEASR